MNGFDPKTPIRLCSLHWGLSLGGVGTYAGMLEDIQHQVPVDLSSVCILGQDWFYNQAVGRKINATIIPIRARWDLGWIHRLTAHLRRTRPQVLMTHGFNGHFVAWMVRRRLDFSLPVICSYHGAYHSPSLQRRLMEGIFNRFSERFLRLEARAIVTVANHCKNYLVHRGVAAHKVQVVHNGITDSMPQTAAGQQLRTEWGVAPDELLVGVVSRLDPVKGISYLMSAAARLMTQFPHVKLALVGSGTLEEKLKKFARAQGIARKCIFTGYRQDVEACLGALDIFALPSLAEYHSIALLEAMRAKKTIVASDVGGNTESVRPDKEALVVPARDSQALYGALRHLVTRPKLRAQLALNARKRFSKQFTMDKMIAKTAQWFIESYQTL